MINVCRSKPPVLYSNHRKLIQDLSPPLQGVPPFLLLYPLGFFHTASCLPAFVVLCIVCPFVWPLPTHFLQTPFRHQPSGRPGQCPRAQLGAWSTVTVCRCAGVECTRRQLQTLKPDEVRGGSRILIGGGGCCPGWYLVFRGGALKPNLLST